MRNPILDAEPAALASDALFASTYGRVTADQASDPFIRARYEEGRRWRHVLAATGPKSGRVLDVGGGNGAIELAFTAAGYWTVSVDVQWNHVARRLHREAGVPLRRIIASAYALPFREGVFSGVVCFDTIEHFDDAPAAGREFIRVLREGGSILLTTPSRLRYLFKGDPHFNIRGLLLLPSSWQRVVVARRGYTAPGDFVDRTYWSVGQLRRLFPGAIVRKILSRSRAPLRVIWDAVVFEKES